MAKSSEAGQNLQDWPCLVELILDFKAFGLATEVWPHTPDCRVTQFMPTCLQLLCSNVCFYNLCPTPIKNFDILKYIYRWLICSDMVDIAFLTESLA